MDIKKEILKRKIKPKGVIHVGAHLGTEVDIYKDIGVKKMILVEPLPHIFTQLQEKMKIHNDVDIRLINKALGSEICKKEMWVETANGGMSSSILRPDYHSIQYPYITFDETIEVSLSTLDKELENNTIDYNILNIDVQGYELEVLKGSISILPKIEILFIEVNGIEMYKGCALINELDNFLEKFGLIRKDTIWYPHDDVNTWGDAIYVR